MWLDTDRADRLGHAEVIFAEFKTPEQTLTAMTGLAAAHPDHSILATRVPAQSAEALLEHFGADATHDPVARTVVLARPVAVIGAVAIVTAGTSDEPVAAECAVTAEVVGLEVTRIRDAGVAGVHRILARRDQLGAADVVIVCAGMDGALPSVVGGLTSVPVIAVPTSVGYGSSFGGIAALLTMLNSCAPGVTVVNIDNGFGAAIAAARIVGTRERSDRRPT